MDVEKNQNGILHRESFDDGLRGLILKETFFDDETFFSIRIQSDWMNTFILAAQKTKSYRTEQ